MRFQNFKLISGSGSGLDSIWYESTGLFVVKSENLNKLELVLGIQNSLGPGSDRGWTFSAAFGRPSSTGNSASVPTGHLQSYTRLFHTVYVTKYVVLLISSLPFSVALLKLCCTLLNLHAYSMFLSVFFFCNSSRNVKQFSQNYTKNINIYHTRM